MSADLVVFELEAVATPELGINPSSFGFFETEELAKAVSAKITSVPKYCMRITRVPRPVVFATVEQWDKRHEVAQLAALQLKLTKAEIDLVKSFL